MEKKIIKKKMKIVDFIGSFIGAASICLCDLTLSRNEHFKNNTTALLMVDGFISLGIGSVFVWLIDRTDKKRNYILSLNLFEIITFFFIYFLLPIPLVIKKILCFF
jgi:hypothetical protein